MPGSIRRTMSVYGILASLITKHMSDVHYIHCRCVLMRLYSDTLTCSRTKFVQSRPKYTDDGSVTRVMPDVERRTFKNKSNCSVGK